MGRKAQSDVQTTDRFVRPEETLEKSALFDAMIETRSKTIQLQCWKKDGFLRMLLVTKSILVVVKKGEDQVEVRLSEKKKKKKKGAR